MVTDDEVKAIVEWADLASTEIRYRTVIRPGVAIVVVVPEGANNLERFTYVEGALIARGMRLDWRHHPDELIRRTVADTLRIVAEWLPEEQRQLVEGPAFAVRGWTPDVMTCPVCQEGPCDDDCPMQRIMPNQAGHPTVLHPQMTF